MKGTLGEHLTRKGVQLDREVVACSSQATDCLWDGRRGERSRGGEREPLSWYKELTAALSQGRTYTFSLTILRKMPDTCPRISCISLWSLWRGEGEPGKEEAPGCPPPGPQTGWSC